MTRFFKFLPVEQKQEFLEGSNERAHEPDRPNWCACGWIRSVPRARGSRCCVATAGAVNRVAQWRTWKSITNSFAAIRAATPKRT